MAVDFPAPLAPTTATREAMHDVLDRVRLVAGVLEGAVLHLEERLTPRLHALEGTGQMEYPLLILVAELAVGIFLRVRHDKLVQHSAFFAFELPELPIVEVNDMRTRLI